MDRLTRPGIDAEQTAVRFMDGGEVKIQDIGDKLLDLILNGPTINGIKKDTLRHLVRQLYNELKAYEDLEMTPEDIEHTLKNFSSFLMEMTGGRMSKTNYTVQAMVAEANDYHQKELEEAEQKGYDLGVDSVLRNHFDIPWAEAADLRKSIDHLRELMTADREGRLMVLPRNVGDTVYTIERDGIEPWKVEYFGAQYYTQSMCTSARLIFPVSCVGKTVFVTQEEAEAALAKMKEKEK